MNAYNEGELTLQDQTKIIGDFHKNNGTILFTNGDRYTGPFHNFKPDGPGVLYT